MINILFFNSISNIEFSKHLIRGLSFLTSTLTTFKLFTIFYFWSNLIDPSILKFSNSSINESSLLKCLGGFIY